MNWLIEPLQDIEQYNKTLEYIRQGNNTAKLNISGPSDSQKAHLSYAILSQLGRKGLFITYNEIQARQFYEDFLFFFGEQVLLYPAKEILYYDVEAKSNDLIFQRISVLHRLLEGDYRLVVTSVDAISHKIFTKSFFEQSILTFEPGQIVDLDGMIKKMVDMGYERGDVVEGKGQFSVRGGIIDIFSPDCEEPFRIELFDNEVDSIRKFDVISQRSTDKVEKARILPAREILLPESKRDLVAGKIGDDLDNYIKTLEINGNSKLVKTLRENIERDMERIKSDTHFPGIDRYIPYIMSEAGHLSDYLEKDTIIFFDEITKVKQRMDNVLTEHHEICKDLLEKGKIMPSNIGMFYSFEDLIIELEKKDNVNFNSIVQGVSGEENANLEALGQVVDINIPCRQIPPYRGVMDIFLGDLTRWKEKNYRVIILAGARARGEKMRDGLASSNVEAVYMEGENVKALPGKIVITQGSLNSSFEYPSIGLVIISDREIFRSPGKIRRTRKKSKGLKINLFTDLNPGDYVVHQTHGIGQYVGIEKLTVDNITKDYIKIKYQGGDYLYIPTSQLDSVQKYIGSEGKAPRLSKLGGSDWVKTKKKVKESLKELAEQLINLYAKRKSIKGFAFSKDTVWQKQFEELFPYEETEDQVRCVEEIKRDMESDKPMDRLLCGDVGYGKTEVALRAAFKAVMDGKQVAFLVPTTVLAQQHYNNFKERFKDFPITIEMISRFRSKAEQSKILKDLSKGNIDILVGTHRLIQKDIKFKDLGLLIIDEEQRFGVMHKEQLKNISPSIDVLTLTATPIPRTLHMSLIGVRDISILEEPPEERYPVQTYVMEYNEEIIRDAITRELNRGGQVYYLYNRVRSIDIKASQIQALVPEARIVVAHGQMDERKLETIMMDFFEYKYDVLICTTIIESGLDIPNVNTIIIEDADRMGLAQLYQLRGRVGRSNRQAYAYITYKPNKVLGEIAEKRLQAIKEFTEFGSGFKIAMRDLGIRGAGNLLGPEQHGHIESVGYEMYCRLLDEAIKDLKGEQPEKKDEEVTIDINVNAYIDDEYISTELQKIEMYKKIASIENEEDVLDIRDELLDRYGELTEPVENLIQIAYIKSLARDLGFTAVSEKGDSVILQLGKEKSLGIETLKKLADKYRRQILFNAGANPYLMYKTSGIKREKLLENIKILLHDIKNFEGK